MSTWIIIILYLILLFIVLISGFLPKWIQNVKQKRYSKVNVKSSIDDFTIILREVTTALEELHKLNKGAIIVFERSDKVDQYIVDGDKIDAIVSKPLLVTIFEGDKTPLHDGATIIRDGRIIYAGSFIVTLTSKKIARSYGTRHRSAIGLSEKTDALILVLSEETGDVSICWNCKTFIVEAHLVYDEITKILKSEED